MVVGKFKWHGNVNHSIDVSLKQFLGGRPAAHKHDSVQIDSHNIVGTCKQKASIMRL